MKVIIESPYSGDVEENLKYAKLAMKDSLDRGEYPLASHLLYTLVLDDKVPSERDKGINAGLEWAKYADKTVVYEDYGISKGMKYGIEHAKKYNRPIEYRRLFK